MYRVWVVRLILNLGILGNRDEFPKKLFVYSST